ncbi:MAG TPA: hypothetical protein PLP23_01980 [Panacibacter sp.]|nr:hypothetical protein [Panacibacter sp.]
MDRKIANGNNHARTTLFKPFEYHDLFPYTFAVLGFTACAYILCTFISITEHLH